VARIAEILDEIRRNAVEIVQRNDRPLPLAADQVVETCLHFLVDVVGAECHRNRTRLRSSSDPRSGRLQPLSGT
jgi:hypothetical protein